MKQDDLYQHRSPTPFTFDSEVADVFDDMIKRSVPSYDTAQGVIIDLVALVAKPGGTVLDIGCATGSTLKMLQRVRSDLNLIGVDNSIAMLDKVGEPRGVYCQYGDILDPGFDLPKAHCVLMLYTLQFIRPLEREGAIKRLYESLPTGGLLVLAEKVVYSEPTVHDLIVKLHYQYKRRCGYSSLEIAAKREALENVLIPFTPEENMNMLASCGFGDVEVIFRHFNFDVYMGFKV